MTVVEQGGTTVEVIEGLTTVVEVGTDVATVIEVDTPGPQGIQGTPGLAGAGFNFVHDQGTPSSVWVIVHNLNGYPNITVVDSAGTEVEGTVTYDSANQVTVSFAGAFSGKAFLS